MTSEDRLAEAGAQLGLRFAHQGVKHYLEGGDTKQFLRNTINHSSISHSPIFLLRCTWRSEVCRVHCKAYIYTCVTIISRYRNHWDAITFSCAPSQYVPTIGTNFYQLSIIVKLSIHWLYSFLNFI